MGEGNIDACKGYMCASVNPVEFCRFEGNSGHISGQGTSDSALIY